MDDPRLPRLTEAQKVGVSFDYRGTNSHVCFTALLKADLELLTGDSSVIKHRDEEEDAGKLSRGQKLKRKMKTKKMQKQQVAVSVLCWKRLWGHACTTGWMHACMNTWIDACMNTWIDACMNTWIDACMNTWIDAWMDACMNTWIDACMNTWIDAWMDACMNT